MFDSLKRSVRDLRDITRRARNTRELMRAILPARWQKRVVLNPEPPTGASLAPDRLAENLRQLRNQLEAAAIDDRGRVDYRALTDADAFHQLRETARHLHTVAPADLTDDDHRHAFWINLYNVLAIHGVIDLGIERSVMEIPSFFARVAYRIGTHTFTLDDIENGVLRINAPHPATRERMFRARDPRLAYCVDRLDPRIHMALVCAANSCPPVAFYEAERIDEQLATAVLGYVAQEVQLDDGDVRLPIIFRYYEADFGGPDGIWSFLDEYAEGAQKQALAQARANGGQFSYRRYDWSLNGVP